MKRPASPLPNQGTLSGEVSGLDKRTTGRPSDSLSLTIAHGGWNMEKWWTSGRWGTAHGRNGASGCPKARTSWFPEAKGYLPWSKGLMFEVPSEGMDWRERNLGFRFVRPEDAAGKPVSQGTGWLPERSVQGTDSTESPMKPMQQSRYNGCRVCSLTRSTTSVLHC